MELRRRCGCIVRGIHLISYRLRAGPAPAALALSLATSAPAQVINPMPAGDALVLAGVGHVGTWHTEAEAVNPNSGPVVLETNAFFVGVFLDSSPCPDPCRYRDDIVPGLGSVSLEAAFQKALFSGFSTIYITPKPKTGLLLAVVHARLVNDVNPSQAVDVPIISLSTLTRIDPSVLTFPGAIRHGPAHSNLLIANVWRLDFSIPTFPPTVSARVTAYSPDGTLLGSLDTGVIQEHFVYLTDVLGRLGVSDLMLGSVRVTRLGGTGLLWGIMYTADENGAVTATIGLNPDSALPQPTP